MDARKLGPRTTRKRGQLGPYRCVFLPQNTTEHHRTPPNTTEHYIELAQNT